MGEPVKKPAEKVVTPDYRCPDGKYLDVNEKGEWICTSSLGLIGDNMSCGERGGPPCDFGQERFGIPKKPPASPSPPPPPDQFKPAALKGLKKLITGQAEYNCKTQMPHTEYWTIHRDVSIPGFAAEPEANTRSRLEQAARDLAKTIGGCQSVKFIRVVVPPSEPPIQSRKSLPKQTTTVRK